ncbi:gamma-aminobutyric acid receptor alpha-like [Macrosteles quadrilineatus]|uniref:gamma-aminobutyric acid receptor alpha-like n=1 Tax=Macrosteles quadrilineatus TaxID=74068 RepID=UPI0023E12F03|nr:gamma-aminobutyric acid receptor alpha-like [Macrosteles quadrilineatus]
MKLGLSPLGLLLIIHVQAYTTPRNTLGSQRNNHRNVSELLDNLLRGYDNSVRPGLGGPPAIVEVDIMVRSMGPISEVDMTYSMDCYFRQTWVDRRLAFLSDKDTLALSITMLERIWKPDTYFYNGKQSYLHTITTPNKFVRLYQDGRVLYSSRLTIKAGCPMNLENFPMDTQRCPLKFGSFGYTVNDVLYVWNGKRQVAIADDMKLSQFDLIATPAANQTDYLKSGEYSMLLVSFHLQRHMGNFLIQVYGPCVLLVVLSWVSFWLNREATADRVSLGITTVLTMTFLGLEARTDLPKVPYPTALDFFVFLSFGFIFATIIQFALVHYFTKYGSGECYFSVDWSSSDSSDEDDWATRRTIEPMGAGRRKSSSCGVAPRRSVTINGNTRLLEVIPLSACDISSISGRGHRDSWTSGLPSCLGCAKPSSTHHSPCRESVYNPPPKRPSITFHPRGHRRKKRTPRFNSVSKIDRISRVFFPVCFFAINLSYWYAYLSRSERIPLRTDVAV